MSNCLVYALRRWIRDGGYLIVRRSRWGWWPHFLWAPTLGDLEVEQYAPRQSQRRLCPPLLFRGRVKVGTDDD